MQTFNGLSQVVARNKLTIPGASGNAGVDTSDYVVKLVQRMSLDPEYTDTDNFRINQKTIVPRVTYSVSHPEIVLNGRYQVAVSSARMLFDIRNAVPKLYAHLYENNDHPLQLDFDNLGDNDYNENGYQGLTTLNVGSPKYQEMKWGEGIGREDTQSGFVELNWNNDVYGGSKSAAVNSYGISTVHQSMSFSFNTFLQGLRFQDLWLKFAQDPDNYRPVSVDLELTLLFWPSV